MLRSTESVVQPGPAHAGPAGSTAPAIRRLPGRRRPWLVALGLMLAAIGALVTVWMVGAAGQRQEVLALRNDVPYGNSLSAEDIVVVRVSMDPGVHSIPASSARSVIGMVAAADLMGGALLTPGQLEPQGDPRPGWVLVPLALPSSRLPAGGLRAGDRILVVDPESPSTGQTEARVVRIGPEGLNGVSVLDVTTLVQHGPTLAAAAAQGRVSVVLTAAVS